MTTIYHVGGWGRNYGDLAIRYSMEWYLNTHFERPVRFVPIDCKDERPIDLLMVEEINDCGDQLLVGGGGMIMGGDGFKSLSGWQFNISKTALEKLRIPLVCYALGYNYFPGDKLNQYAQSHLKAVQEKCESFSVRDPLSKKQLEFDGLASSKIDVFPDPAMFCPSRKHSIPGIESRDFVILLNWAMDRENSRFHAADEDEMIKKVCEAINKLLLWLACDYDKVHVIFTPHIDKYDNDRRWKFEQHLNLTNLKVLLPRLFPESYEYVPSFVGIYERANLVLGMRGHANILPFGKGTPVVGFGDHVKNKAISEYLKTDHVSNNCADLYEILLDALTNEEKHSERLIRKYELLDLHSKGMQKIVSCTAPSLQRASRS